MFFTHLILFLLIRLLSSTGRVKLRMERPIFKEEECFPFNDTSRHKHRSIFLGIQ